MSCRVRGRRANRERGEQTERERRANRERGRANRESEEGQAERERWGAANLSELTFTAQTKRG